MFITVTTRIAGDQHRAHYCRHDRARRVAAAYVGDDGPGHQEQQADTGQCAEQGHGRAERDAEGAGEFERPDAAVRLDREARIGGQCAHRLESEEFGEPDQGEDEGDEGGEADGWFMTFPRGW